MQRTKTGRSIMIAMLAWMPPFCAAQQKAGVSFDHGASRMMRSRSVGFALNAAQVIAGEIQLAQLAIQHATDPEVKQFAQRLIAENHKISDDLTATAAKQHLTLPDNATEQLISQHASLLRRSGPPFDSSFVNDLVTDTREQIASFQRQAGKGKDPGLKSFAERTLPMLQARLDTAKSLRVSKGYQP